MTADPPSPAADTAPGTGRLVVSARAGGWRSLSVSGWLLVMVGSFLGANGVAAVVLLAMGRDLSDPVWLVIEEPLDVGLACLDVGCLLGFSAFPMVSGVAFLSDSWRLQQFWLVLDVHGVASDCRPGGVVPWERIRHVALTSGSPGLRRLLVDDGVAPAWWWWAPALRPGRAMLRQLFGRRAILVNVPIDRLNVEATEILRAIHHYSGGRFPDRPSDSVDRGPRGQR